MLKELVDAAGRFTVEGKLEPIGYKRKSLDWIIDLGDSGEVDLKGPFKRGELRQMPVPDRQQSGRVSESNLKPYLLVEKGSFALGIPEPGKERQAGIAHRGFLQLLMEAQHKTGDEDLTRIYRFLMQPLPASIRQAVKPRDLVGFQCGSHGFPFDKEVIKRFWADYLAEELLSKTSASCAVCAHHGPILRILPNEIVVMGQKCQITSFNLSAFRSFGREQTTNAPLCYRCATSVRQALSCLMAEPAHHAVVARDETKTKSRPLDNQLAVFWLKAPLLQQLDGTVVDIEAALSTFMQAPQQRDGPDAPVPELAQIEALVRIPWTSRQAALHIDTNGFYIAVLSANKARLVVRDWITVPLDDLREHLAAFLGASRIVGPTGDKPRPFPISVLLKGIKSTDPAHIRGLLHSAYTGASPPQEILVPAVDCLRNLYSSESRRRRRNPKGVKDEHALQIVASALKLVLTHRKEEAESLEALDVYNRATGYLCGRILAILEEIQRRASSGKLNSTIVDNFYSSASLAPGSTLPELLRLTESAHLPKIRKQRRGYGELRSLLEEVLGGFKPTEGIPGILKLNQQAEFALGFYHQRADFAGKRMQRQAKTNDDRANQGGGNV